MSSSKRGLFVAWRIFQRRNISVANKFGLEPRFYYRTWEEKSRVHKASSYIFKSLNMLRDLIKFHPDVIFLQLPPVPVLYIVALFCRLTGCRYVADCHNVMIYSKWLNWPFAKTLLNAADALLVHNEDVSIYARQLGLNTITLRDPLPDLKRTTDPDLLAKYGLKKDAYVIVPWSFASDEPILELFQAAKAMPETKYVMTWFAEKLPVELREILPANLILTGYLDDNAFNAIFSDAGVALVLTTREGTQPSSASEAISLEIPLIVSDLDTTRKLYKNTPVYIENTTQGILTGVAQAFHEQEQRITAIRAFGKAYGRDLDEEIDSVKNLLGLGDRKPSDPS